MKIYAAADKHNQIEPVLRGARSSAPTPSGSSVRPYEAATSYTSYTSPDFSGYDSRSSGYGTRMPPSSQTPEALKKQQEEFARAAELRQMLANLDKVDDQGRRSSLLDTLCSTEDVLNLPEHPNPPGIASGELRVDLLKHQVCDYSIFQEVYRYSISWRIDRNKRCNGLLSTKIQNFRRRKRISLCSSGSTERQAPRCVAVCLSCRRGAYSQSCSLITITVRVCRDWP